LRILGRPTLLWTADQPPDTTDAAPADPFDPAVAVEVTAALSTRVRDLLVFLALHPDGVRRDAAVAALWPDTGSSRPRNNLSSLIRRLRTGLHDALTAITDPATTHPATDDLHAATATDTPPGIDAVDRLVLLEGDRCRLDPRVVAVDYWTFLDAALLASGNPVTHPMTHQAVGRPDTPRTNAAHPTPEPPADRAAARQRRLTADLDTPALARLHDAHRLYRGPLAEDIDDAWIVSLREFTRRSFLTITARLVRHYVTTAPAAALAVLETTRNVEPINQSIYRDIMALQLQDGDNESAATTLRLLRAYLDDIEEPLDDDTRELARQIDLRIDL
jgi:DNA-binding SARP family transcriptional activator